MLPIETLNHPLTAAIGWTLIHFLWQGAIVGILAAITLTAMRNRTASARYAVGIFALVVMAVCPIVTVGLLSYEPEPSTLQAPTAAVIPAPQPASTAELPPLEEPADVIVIPSQVATATEKEPTKQPAPELTLTDKVTRFAPWMAIAWFVGAALLSLRLLFSWFQVLRITQFGLKPVEGAIQRTFDSLCHRMGLRRFVRVFESTLIAVPATVGWLRPIVLLPATAITGLSQEQLIAVLAHELAHVRRYDYAVNLIQGVVETLLFYHPGIWLLSERIRTERENCCDDAAVAITGEPIEYVRALTQLAESAPVPRLATASTGGELATRARRLLGHPTGSQTPRSAGIIGMLTLSLVCLAINATTATSSEQDRTEEQTEKELPLSDNPKWIVAKHAIIYEGKTVVDWDQVKETAKRHQGSGKDFFPEFRFTRGWLRQGTTQERRDRYKRLSDAVSALGRRFGTIEGLSADRRGFDSVKTQSDLNPNPDYRVIGRVLTPDGKPASAAQIVMLPKPKPDEIQEVEIAGPRLGDPFQEKMATTNKSGGFTAYPAPTDDKVLILHRSGFSANDRQQNRKWEGHST